MKALVAVTKNVHARHDAVARGRDHWCGRERHMPCGWHRPLHWATRLVLRARTRYTSEVDRSGASVVMMSVTIGAYQAVYFESVSQAVEYCHALVPHIVPRPGGRDAPDERAVVWFHVPERSR